MPPSAHRLRLALTTLVVAATSVAGRAQGEPAQRNPFLPPSGNAAPAAAAGEVIEFAGVSSVGKRTDLVFFDKNKKKNYWVGVGETKDGIAVLSYDSRREQATIKLDGTEKILPLRKGASAAAGARGAPAGFNLGQPVPAPVAIAAPVAQSIIPNPVPEPTAPPPSPTPAPANSNPPTVAETQRKQETEARMLVSDLLEIGMAQRKAYEDAQRKAADSTTPPNPPPAEPVRQP